MNCILSFWFAYSKRLFCGAEKHPTATDHLPLHSQCSLSHTQFGCGWLAIAIAPKIALTAANRLKCRSQLCSLWNDCCCCCCCCAGWVKSVGATSRSQVSSPLSRKSIGCHPFWAPPSNDEKRAKDKERGQQSAAEIEADEASKASKQENGFFYLPLLLGIDKAQCGFASLRLYNNFICLPWVFVSCFLLSFFFFYFLVGWQINTSDWVKL